MCNLFTYANTYMPRFSPCGFFGPSRCLIPTPGVTTEYLTCAGVRINTHTHTYTPTLVKKREDTNKNPYLSFCQK